MISTSDWPFTSTSCWRCRFVERALVHGLDLAGVDAGELVRRFDPPEELAAHPRRRQVVRLPRGHHQRPGRTRSIPIRACSGSPGSTGTSRCSAWSRSGRSSRRSSASSRPIRVTESLIALWPSRGSMYDFECSIVFDVVVVLQAPVAGQPHRHRLVTAVHRHQVDVDVDDQVATRRRAWRSRRPRPWSVVPISSSASGSSASKL